MKAMRIKGIYTPKQIAEVTAIKENVVRRVLLRMVKCRLIVKKKRGQYQKATQKRQSDTESDKATPKATNPPLNTHPHQQRPDEQPFPAFPQREKKRETVRDFLYYLIEERRSVNWIKKRLNLSKRQAYKIRNSLVQKRIITNPRPQIYEPVKKNYQNLLDKLKHQTTLETFSLLDITTNLNTHPHQQRPDEQPFPAHAGGSRNPPLFDLSDSLPRHIPIIVHALRFTFKKVSQKPTNLTPPFGKWIHLNNGIKYRQFKMYLNLGKERLGDALIQQWDNDTWIIIMPHIVLNGFPDPNAAQEHIIKLTIATANKIRKLYGVELKLTSQCRLPEVGQPGHPATYEASNQLAIIDPHGERWYIDGSPDPRRELEVRGWGSISKTLYVAYAGYQLEKIKEHDGKVDTILGIVIDKLFNGVPPPPAAPTDNKKEPEGYL